ncbi:MAG: hypothetical protein LBK47_04140 [Prevotellaceae bacterium]|jgi:16S rRNA processing protein RimM|nr:hypothetical protein [Prevotellaceae bacterium]
MEAIGKIQKTFGAHGELVVALYDDHTLPTGKPVFIEINGLLAPFYVNKAEKRGQKLTVVFDDMEAEALAAELVGREIMVAPSARQRRKKSTAPNEGATPDELIGYKVIDLTHGELGSAASWMDYPGNPCIQVVNPRGQEIIIPANEALIVSIDRDAKVLSVDLPQGLLELYINNL